MKDTVIKENGKAPETNHWSNYVVDAVQRILPAGTVFVLAVGTPGEPFPDGRRPVDFQVLTNTDPEYARKAMGMLGGGNL